LLPYDCRRHEIHEIHVLFPIRMQLRVAADLDASAEPDSVGPIIRRDEITDTCGNQRLLALFGGRQLARTLW
jgi:hypothetical protein